jgi:hypothetical protein
MKNVSLLIIIISTLNVFSYSVKAQNAEATAKKAKEQNLKWLELKGPENMYYYMILHDSIWYPIPDPPYFKDTIGYSLQLKNPTNNCKEIWYEEIVTWDGKTDTLNQWLALKPNSEFECYEPSWDLCWRSYLQSKDLISFKIVKESNSDRCKGMDKLKRFK